MIFVNQTRSGCAATENTQINSIVAVHGLNGHALKTWTTENSQSSWLSDKEMLPKVVHNARILTWGYDANVTALLGSASSDRILQHAHTLVAQLEADRSVSELLFAESHGEREDAEVVFSG